MRGYEWYDMVKQAPNFSEELSGLDLTCWKYPSDSEIEDVGVRGIYISNFFKWEANEHGPLMAEKYGFLESEEPFERTYRMMSNLDDMHENGIHDYMKWVKFGYGRATDHTSKDIRTGRMSRAEGVNEIIKRDHIKSKDLSRWLEYVSWTEDEFDRSADQFREPSVWWIKNGEWWKRDIDGESRSYGPVTLSVAEQQSYYREG